MNSKQEKHQFSKDELEEMLENFKTSMTERFPQFPLEQRKAFDKTTEFISAGSQHMWNVFIQGVAAYCVQL